MTQRRSVGAAAVEWQAGFAARLDQAMRARNLTQNALALEIGCSQSQVNGWLRGSQTISGAFLSRIPEVLNVASEWLLTGAGPSTRGASPHAAAEAYLRGQLDELTRTVRSMERRYDELSGQQAAIDAATQHRDVAQTVAHLDRLARGEREGQAAPAAARPTSGRRRKAGG